MKKYYIFHVRADEKHGQAISSKLAPYEVDEAEDRVGQLEAYE